MCELVARTDNEIIETVIRVRLKRRSIYNRLFAVSLNSAPDRVARLVSGWSTWLSLLCRDVYRRFASGHTLDTRCQ